jgi:hypothetical protein
MKYDFLLGKNNIQMVSTCLSKTRVKQCKYVPWLFVMGALKTTGEPIVRMNIMQKTN